MIPQPRKRSRSAPRILFCVVVITTFLLRQTNNYESVTIAPLPASLSQASKEFSVRTASNHSDVSYYLERSIDFSIPPKCGMFKCLYTAPNNNMGFMLGQELPNTTKTFAILEQGYRKADSLSLRHFMRGPPEYFVPTERLLQKMNSKISLGAAATQSKEYMRATRPFPRSGMDFFVQPVDLAPSSSLAYGCTHHKRLVAQQEMAEYVRAVRRERIPSFRTVLTAQIQKLASLIPREPWVLYDFQIIFDIRGNVWHMDVDRCCEWNATFVRQLYDRGEFQNCWHDFTKFAAIIMELVENLED